jgi:hypothetical protein
MEKVLGELKKRGAMVGGKARRFIAKAPGFANRFLTLLLLLIRACAFCLVLLFLTGLITLTILVGYAVAEHLPAVLVFDGSLRMHQTKTVQGVAGLIVFPLMLFYFVRILKKHWGASKRTHASHIGASLLLVLVLVKIPQWLETREVNALTSRAMRSDTHALGFYPDLTNLAKHFPEAQPACSNITTTRWDVSGKGERSDSGKSP